MTEYIFSKRGKDIKRIQCSEEFAQSIAIQTGCEVRKVPAPVRPTTPPTRKTRRQRIIEDITREAAEVTR